MTQYLTISDAAEALSVSVNTIRAMLPKLGAVDLKGGSGKNRMIRIPEDAITAYLRECGIPDPAAVIESRIAKPETPFRLERRKS